MVHAILCCIGKIGRRQSGRLLQLLSPHPEFLSCLEPIAKFVISNLESIYMHPPSDFFDDDILYTAELAKHLLRITVREISTKFPSNFPARPRSPFRRPVHARISLTPLSLHPQTHPLHLHTLPHKFQQYR